MSNGRIDKPKTDSLDDWGHDSQPSLAAELFDFLKYNKKWWLLPIILILLALSLLVALSSTAVAPFIYTVF